MIEKFGTRELIYTTDDEHLNLYRGAPMIIKFKVRVFRYQIVLCCAVIVAHLDFYRPTALPQFPSREKLQHSKS